MQINRFLSSTIKRLKSIKNLFLNQKKSWWRPPESPIVIYDRAGSEVIASYLDEGSYAVLETRGESVNVYVLGLYLLEKIFNKDSSYFHSFISCVRPKCIITFIDNNPSFYLLKKRFPEVVTVFIQNGGRGGYNDIFYKLEKGRINCSEFAVDYMLVFGSSVGDLYQEYVTGVSISIGSFKNNLFNLDFIRDSNTLTFVSEYRTPYSLKKRSYWSDNDVEFNEGEYRQSEVLVLQFLKNQCIRDELSLCISGSILGGSEEEIEFYNHILADFPWTYIPRLNNQSTYQQCSKSKYIAFINSTVGYEFLSRGSRVMAFTVRAGLVGIGDLAFGWPAELPSVGPFWTNIVEPDIFQAVYDFVVSSDEDEWAASVEKYMAPIMVFDPGNTKFLGLLEKLDLIT